MGKTIRAPRLRRSERYEGPVELPSIWRGCNENGTENPKMEIRVLAAHPDGPGRGWLYEWTHKGSDRRANREYGCAPDENLRRIFRPAETQPEEASPMADETQRTEDSTDAIGAELLGTPDPRRWAEAFIDAFGTPEKNGEIDEDLMLAWFSNAMQAKETAIEKAARENSDDAAEERPHRFTTAALHELVLQVAGAAAGTCMRNAPDLVMPSEELIVDVNAVLIDKGIPETKSGPSDPREGEGAGD